MRSDSKLRMTLLVIVALASLDARAQRPAPQHDFGTFSSSQIVSAVVVATWLVKTAPTGNELEALVLWRGSPGWFMRTGNVRVSGGGYPGGFRTDVNYGGVPLDFDINTRTRQAKIRGEAIDLSKGNVVLVDDVDSAAGLRILGTTATPSRMDEPDRIDLVLRGSPELLEYLRCDAQVPLVQARALMETACKDPKK